MLQIILPKSRNKPRSVRYLHKKRSLLRRELPVHPEFANKLEKR